MLKALWLVFVLSSLAAAATTGFAGVYAPSNWQFTNDVFGNSQVNWSAPDSVTVSRNNAFPPQPSITELTMVAPFTGTVSFDYSFSTGDPDYTTVDNEFGILEDGAQLVLFDSVTTGTAGTNPFYIPDSFQVTAGETFGFFTYTASNNSHGGESFTIENFDAATPEPSSLALLRGGIGILVLRLKRRRAR